MHTLPGSYIPSPGGGKAKESEPQTTSVSAMMQATSDRNDAEGDGEAIFPEMDVEEPEGPSVEVFTEHTIETVLALDIMSLLHPWYAFQNVVFDSTTCAKFGNS